MPLKFSYHSQLWPLLKYLTSNYCKHKFSCCHKHVVVSSQSPLKKLYSVWKKKRHNFVPPIKAVKKCSHFLLQEAFYCRAQVSPQTLFSNQPLDTIFKKVRAFLEKRSWLPQNEFPCIRHKEVCLLSLSQNERNFFLLSF